MSDTKKPIREFGRVFDYLKNTVMRETEQEPGHITIEDAEFNGEDFANATWRYFRFVRCHFPASHLIQLEEMEGCGFDKCTFGPSRHDDTMDFGHVKGSHNHFTRCSFTRANVGFTQGQAYFERCTFENPDDDPNRGYFLAGEELTLRHCKARNYSLIGDKKLHLLFCEFTPSPKRSMASLMSDADPANKKEPVADFIFEGTIFRNAEKILWNTWIKSLTLSRVEVEGEFSTWMGKIRETLILDGITKGYYFVGRTGTRKKIVVRNCHFSEAHEENGHLLDCSADYAAEVLVENVECSAAGSFNLTGAGDGAKIIAADFREEFTLNKTFVIRGCKIPHLQINWLQTFDLLIENCEIGKLEMRDGRLGNVTIRNTKFETLDLSRTLAAKYDIAPSGKIITVESNYPKGGYKII